MKRQVFLGADHAGFYMKEAIKDALILEGFDVEDLGAHKLDPHDDYPEFAERVAEAVLEHPGSFGVLSCGNAEGIMIAANKFDGIRAGLGYSLEAARTMRQDDNANIISVPGRVATQDDAISIVKAFLTTPFSGKRRHLRRLKQLLRLEKEN
jgi:ribose 5-phosphate isomerase B